MSPLEQLNILDLRSTLPRANWTLGGCAKTSVTLHYNGPPVANRSRDGEIQQLIGDAWWHMKRGVLSPNGGDGIMYEYAVLSDGTICRLRNPCSILWHCGTPSGNSMSLAVHLPLGGDQDATPVQWNATTRLFDALIAEYRLAGRHLVFGHQEWTSTDCPGRLMPRLIAWRTGAQISGQSQPDRQAWSRRLYQIVVDTANVRAKPTTDSEILRKVQRDTVVDVDWIIESQPVDGVKTWLHIREGGYVHASLTNLIVRRFKLKAAEVNIRTSATTQSKIWRTVKQPEIISVAEIVEGEKVDGSNGKWARLAGTTTYAYVPLLEEVKA